MDGRRRRAASGRARRTAAVRARLALRGAGAGRAGAPEALEPISKLAARPDCFVVSSLAPRCTSMYYLGARCGPCAHSGRAFEIVPVACNAPIRNCRRTFRLESDVTGRDANPLALLRLVSRDRRSGRRARGRRRAAARRVRSTTGVAGRLLVRRDDPATWMEVYEARRRRRALRARAGGRGRAPCGRRAGPTAARGTPRPSSPPPDAPSPCASPSSPSMRIRRSRW